MRRSAIVVAIASIVILSTSPVISAPSPEDDGAAPVAAVPGASYRVEASEREPSALYPLGENDIGNHCDDCTTAITFPFPVTFYGETFTTARVSSNGNLQFIGDSIQPTTNCLPNADLGGAVLLFQRDLKTSATGGYVWTDTTGLAPNRIFVIEWSTHFYGSVTEVSSFYIWFRENNPRIEVGYFGNADDGDSAVSGIQASASGPATEFSCMTPELHSELLLTYIPTMELAVAKAGPGSGTVTSSPAGIDCGPTCSSHFDEDSVVTLSAQSDVGSRFSGWSGGGCSGTGTCSVTVDAQQTVTATFDNTPRCPGFENDPGLHVVGTTGDDVLVGTPGRDIICGLGGDDELRGLGDNDRVIGGGGKDLLLGGGGADTLKGSAGKDLIKGGKGGDLLIGGPGRDVVNGGAGIDACRAEVRRMC